MGAELETRWEAQMRALFPDVKTGDRITGVHQPRTGAVFWSNARLLGEIRDPAFAKLFFGIWLAPQTSEPQLRQALLAQAKAMAPGVTTP
jgi:Chalcone isomerase-like